DKFYNMVVHWVKEKSFTIKVEVINDLTTTNEDRLGAIGDINLVIEKENICDDILIVAGDNLFEFNIVEFVAFGQKKEKFSVALFDVKDLKLAQRYGTLVIDSETSMVEDFQEKSLSPKSTLASTGIYYFPKTKLPMLIKYMQTDLTKDAPGNFVKWISENDEVFGYVFTEGWYDIGDKISLGKADVEYREREAE
ncbi:MAG: sugar phosphate nucleotidyltransferase, partial [Candidatus Omnitrophota bacterium]